MRSLTFDYAVSICCVWVVAGIFVDVWAHGHVPVETFFTPYHGAIYAGALTLVVVFVAFGARNLARGSGWRDCIPAPYRVALLGFPIFLVSGVGDYFWHLLLGLESGVDAVLSPTHQGLGLGMLFVASGPIRSTLAYRKESSSFTRQVPLVLGLLAWYGIVHLATAYAFDPGAARADAPPAVAYSARYFTAVTLGYYTLAVGVLVIIFQAVLVSGFALWAVSQIRLRPGAFTILFTCANAMAAAPFTNQTPLLAIAVVASIAAGIVADVMVAALDPRPDRPEAYRWFSAIVPMVYSGIFLLATQVLAGGIWWDWNVVLGAWCWAGVAGLGLSFIALAHRS